MTTAMNTFVTSLTLEQRQSLGALLGFGDAPDAPAGDAPAGVAPAGVAPAGVAPLVLVPPAGVVPDGPFRQRTAEDDRALLERENKKQLRRIVHT